MNLSKFEAEVMCKIKQCSKAEVAIFNDMLDGVLSKHESADLKIEIKDWKVKLEDCEIRNVQLEVEIKEVQEELAHLAHELGLEQSRNQEADDEEQRKGQKFLGSEHDDAKGVYE